MSFYIQDEVAMSRFKGWEGPVGDDLNRRAKTLAFRARTSVGHLTGRLAADIEIRTSTVSDGIEAQVGSWHTPYAAAQHEGAIPHVITGHNGGYLVFTIAGRTIFTRSVNHPGNPANPFLSRWLAEAVK